jgi:hypothetical protein
MSLDLAPSPCLLILAKPLTAIQKDERLKKTGKWEVEIKALLADCERKGRGGLEDDKECALLIPWLWSSYNHKPSVLFLYAKKM